MPQSQIADQLMAFIRKKIKHHQLHDVKKTIKVKQPALSSEMIAKLERTQMRLHTGKCLRRFAGIYAYCRYFIDQKWQILVLIIYRKT